MLYCVFCFIRSLLKMFLIKQCFESSSSLSSYSCYFGNARRSPAFAHSHDHAHVRAAHSFPCALSPHHMTMKYDEICVRAKSGKDKRKYKKIGTQTTHIRACPKSGPVPSILKGPVPRAAKLAFACSGHW